MKPAVRKNEIPGSRALVVNYLEDSFFDPSWHFHSEYQLFVVLEGSGTRFVGDNIAHFQEGDLVFTGSNLPHLWRNDEKYFKKGSNLRVRGIVVYFAEDFLGKGLWEKEEMLELRQLLEKGKRGLEISGEKNRQIISMMKDLLHLNGVDSIIQILNILHIIARSNDHKYISSIGYINTSRESDKDRLNEVYNYLMLNFKRDVRLEEVAEIASMSPTAFSRNFKVRTNKSFSDFIRELRIGHACKLLLEDKYTISHICYESGYNTLSNFNKQFRELMHKTPFEYKKEYLKVI